MSAPYKRVVIAWTLLFVSLPAFGEDAKGWYDPCCYDVTFHLKISRQTREITVHISLGMLQFGPYIAGPDWWKANAQRCAAANACEEATTAKFQFPRITNKRASGNYILEFEGQRFEGHFSVKRRPVGRRCICE
jgi:hypothetical protein